MGTAMRMDVGVFVVLIQDFSDVTHEARPFRMLRLCNDCDDGRRVLANCGQREPGMVVEVLALNDRPRATARDPAVEGLTEYEACRGGFLVLSHLPRTQPYDTFAVTSVFGPGEEDVRGRAALCLREHRFSALLGRIHEIDDSEHGPYQVLRKTADSPGAHGIA